MFYIDNEYLFFFYFYDQLIIIVTYDYNNDDVKSNKIYENR